MPELREVKWKGNVNKKRKKSLKSLVHKNTKLQPQSIKTRKKQNNLFFFFANFRFYLNKFLTLNYLK